MVAIKRSQKFIKILKVFLVLLPWFVLLSVSPVMGTLAINKHSRNVLIETWSHWISEQRSAIAVFCGDSLIAGGGHWGPRLGAGYLTTRNLAGNGYSVRQTIYQVKKAAIYNPSWIVIGAGTNDAVNIAAGRQTIEETVLDLRELINTSEADLILILPPPTRNSNINIVVSELRQEMNAIAQVNDVRVIDVWDNVIDEEGLLQKELTTDGVHFSEKAYKLLSGKIHDQMF